MLAYETTNSIIKHTRLVIFMDPQLRQSTLYIYRRRELLSNCGNMTSISIFHILHIVSKRLDGMKCPCPIPMNIEYETKAIAGPMRHRRRELLSNCGSMTSISIFHILHILSKRLDGMKCPCPIPMNIEYETKAIAGPCDVL